MLHEIFELIEGIAAAAQLAAMARQFLCARKAAA
jgi:hypothetical protein